MRDGGVCVVALDTELLGHWWFEGVAWLRAVIEAAERRGLPFTTLEAAGDRHPARAPGLPVAPSSWGEGADLRTWSAPPVAELAFTPRRAELELHRAPDPSLRAQRELLALQSSDWAFLAYRGTAGDYPRERAAGHRDTADPGAGRRSRTGALAAGSRSGPRRLRGRDLRGPSGARRGRSLSSQPMSDSPAQPDPNRWKALGVCLVAGFMTLLDVSIVNVALPSIKTGLAAPDNALQWIVSGYALALGLLLVPSGRLGDARGRRPVFMFGIAAFVLASAACGAAPSALVLVIGRIVQGFAGGFITPQISAFIQTLFSGEERGKAFGFFGTTVGLSTAIGPLTGGALISIFGVHSGWRAVFFVNVPVGALALVLARRYLPAPSPQQRAERTHLDPIGVLLLGLTVISVLVPFIELRSWHSPLRPLLFPLAAVFAAAWVWHERRYGRTHEPLVSLDLFRIRSYVLGAGVGILYFAGFTGTFFILTQYLQIGLHYSALQAGLSATPFAIGGALTASLGSRQVLRRGRKLVAGGLITVIAGLALTWVAVHAVPGHDVGFYTAAPLLLAGLGGGLVISPNNTLSLSLVPTARAGSAGGVLQTGQRIGSAAGIAITGSVFYSELAGSRGDFALAFRHGLVVIAAFVAAALVMALIDVATGRVAATRTAPEPTG